MNWKKRVVSIILMLTTIITILPAEQVFALDITIDDSTAVEDSELEKEINEAQKYLSLPEIDFLYQKVDLCNKDENLSSRLYYREEGFVKGELRAIHNASYGPKKEKVSYTDTILHSTIGKGAVIQVGLNDASTDDRLFGHKFTESGVLESLATSDISNLVVERFDSFNEFSNTTRFDEDNGEFNIILKDTPDYLKPMITREGLVELYVTETFWLDGDDAKKEYLSNKDKSWLYVRIEAYYSTITGKYYYIERLYSQYGGEGDSIIVAGFVSEAMYYLPFRLRTASTSWDDFINKDNEAAKLYKESLDDFKTFYKKHLYNLVAADIQRAGSHLIPETSTGDFLINIHKTGLNSLYVIPALAVTSSSVSFGAPLNCLKIKEITGSSVKFEIQGFWKEYLTSPFVITAEDPIRDVYNQAFYNYTNNGYAGCYTDASTSTKDQSISLETVEISELEYATGVEETKSIDAKESVWKKFVKQTFGCYRYIVESINSKNRETGSTVADFNGITLSSTLLDRATATYRDRTNTTDIANMIKAMDNGAIKVIVKSDTGALVADKIEDIITEGNYINVDASKLVRESAETYFYWKTIEKQDTVELTTMSDLWYFVGYMDYYLSYSGLTNVSLKVKLTPIPNDIYITYDKSLFGVADPSASKIETDDEDVYIYTFGEVLNCGMGTDLFGKIAHNDPNALAMRDNVTKSLSLLRTGSTYGTGTIMSSLNVTEDELSILKNRQDEYEEFFYSGAVTAVLSYCYDILLYQVTNTLYGVGEDSLSGIPHIGIMSVYTELPFSRAVSLQNVSSEFLTDTSTVDYVPRLPFFDKQFTPEIYTLLYNVEYGASVLDWSTLSDELGSASGTLLEWLENNKANENLATIVTKIQSIVDTGSGALEWAKQGVYDSLPEGYLTFFRMVISIHDICDYLARMKGGSYTGERIAKEWSPAIYAYYSLYNQSPEFEEFFSAIRNNLTNFTMSDYTYSDAIEPLGFVARFKDEQFSSQWKYGYAITSHYVPFQTNLYEISAIEELISDTEWVIEFYYKYGFYRKALYVTTDSEAVVDRILTGTQSGTKVATLRDLLNYERDIELYIDQSFYNADELEKQLDKFISNAGSNSVFGSIFDAISLTPSIILKTGGYSSYSKEVATNVKPIIGNADMVEEKEYAYDSFLLSEDDILGKDGFLSAYEYSIQQPYGVVSAIYRTQEIYNAVGKASVKNQPVFVSSKNAVGIQANNYSNYRMFYNYITLSSLQSIIDHETTLLVDLDSPIFMDIFGNIVTADGYVIIPAAANATLAGDAFTPYSIGYATYVHNADELVYGQLTPQFYDWFYGTDYAYITGKSSISNKTSSYRELCQNTGGGYMFLKNDGTTSMGTTTVTDGVASATVVWDNLNTRLAVLKNLLMSVHFINSANFWDDTHINMVIEVLRGAPMEHIDLDKEGLVVDSGMGPFEAYIAYRVEQLQQSIKTDSNGTEKDKGLSFTFSVLDIFHIESAERIALLAVKCLLIGFLLLLAAMIVADASVGKMPLNVVYRIVVTCILTGACISLIPVLADFSLSTTTRSLLQKEASEMLAMRAQKEAQGIEIGVVQTFPVESTTDIVVKVGELDVQWYDLLLFSAYSSIDNSFEDLYVEAEHGIPIANAPYTVRRGKELYIDIGQIMDTTVVQYDATEGVLTNHVAGYVDEAELSASYMLPYYVILDQLVANVNMYNAKNGVTPKNYSVNSDGSIRTQDLTYAYFHSNEFLTDTYDILDMGRWFNVHTPKIMYAPFFTEDDIKSFNLSVWYPTEADQTQLLNSMDKLYNKAREYVLENSEMLSYVSDAAYLKSLAMYLAVEYNSIFGVGIADAFEVKCLDTEDLLRYVIGTPDQVYKFANRTYARYAHEVNGGLGSLLAGALYIVFCLCNIVKVASFLLVYITCIGSIVYHRIFKREDQYALYGFFILIGELTIVNLVYAALFKVCMNLTRWGVPGILACLLVILFCVGMIFAFLSVGNNGVKNIKNLGRAEVEAINHFFSGVADRMHNHRTAAAPSDAVERTVGVLQAHDFTRQEYDDFEGNRGSVDDLKAHDRRRREGKVKDDSTD